MDASTAFFSRVYAEWFGHVRVWLQSFGVARADCEDVAQEIFLIVHRQLELIRSPGQVAKHYAVSDFGSQASKEVGVS